MQGTVVMLLALSGLGCHHKKCEPAYESACYSSCYSSCYSTASCYSGGYSSCYSSGYSSCYSGGSSACYSGSSCYSGGSSCYSGGSSCYSSCYSSRKHHHGLFGCKRKSCSACCEPVAAPMMAGCDPCSTGYNYGGPPVYGTYTPVFEGYSSGQSMGTSQSYSAPAMGTPTAPGDAAPVMTAPSPGNPPPPPTAAPVPAPPAGS